MFDKWKDHPPSETGGTASKPELADPVPAPVKTLEQFHAEAVVDKTLLISDLSHRAEALAEELQEAREKAAVEHLEAIRSRAAADAYKELLHELIGKK
jgi:hypothetical protein